MKKSQAGFSTGMLVAIVVGVIVVVGGAYYLGQHNAAAPINVMLQSQSGTTTQSSGTNAQQNSAGKTTQNTSIQPVPQPAPTGKPIPPTQTSTNVMSSVTASNVNLQTYKNDKYGFSFQYPGSLSDCGLGCPVALPLSPAPVVTFASGSNAAIGLRVSKDTTYEDCTRTVNWAPGNGGGFSSPTQKIVFNSMTFYQDGSGGVGLSHYRTYYNGACYEFDTKIQGSDYTPTVATFKTILSTFNFSVPSTAAVLHESVPATWVIYLGTFPFTLSYPGTFIVTSESMHSVNGLEAGELDMQEGYKIGMDSIRSGSTHGWISIQQLVPPAGESPTQAMQQQMSTEPIYFPPPGYANAIIAGQQAFMGSNKALSETSAAVIYFVYKQQYYRVAIGNYKAPAGEYDTVVTSFKFNN